MVRRSFRFGLRVGLLIGVVVAFVKLVQARRGALDEPAPGWPRSPEPWTPPAPARVVASRPVPPPDEAPAAPATAKPAAAKPATAKPATAKAAKAADKVARQTDPWVIPADDRCPKSHPVKVKMASKLFHLPGMSAYERTKPDRCYENEAAATKDGFVKAKR